MGYEPTEYYDERPERDHAMLQELISTLQVWNKLLFPLWSNESSKVKEIDFRKDDGEAILILLNIAHLQSGLVPKELDCKILYRIAIRCEQYDCHVVVEPWKYIWLQLQNEANYRYEPGEEDRIYIDWAFGRENSFAKMITDLVRLLEVCPNGEPFVFGCGDFPKNAWQVHRYLLAHFWPSESGQPLT